MFLLYQRASHGLLLPVQLGSLLRYFWNLLDYLQKRMNRCQRRTSFAALLSTHEYRLSSPAWPWNVLLACQVGAIEGRWQLHAGVLVTKMLQFANRHWRYCSVWARWATCQQFKACCKTGGALIAIRVESAKRLNVSAAKVCPFFPSIQEFDCPVSRTLCQIHTCTGLKKFCERLESKRGCSASSSTPQIDLILRFTGSGPIRSTKSRF
mmetsp:Transcript_13876/g.23917  ORF Transcript_13876/g.23917 Transcript_13876/m.23917 type:complete len:209 (-) Transcript_13876:25-651(-)